MAPTTILKMIVSDVSHVIYVWTSQEKNLIMNIKPVNK